MPVCFVICPIGDEGSEIRNDSDLLFDFVLSPVLSAAPFAFELRRADKLAQPGVITNQIISEIETADLVVADLSGGNPNVFYELAIRHVTRKPYVHMKRRGERIPFDNAPIRAIDYDLRDLRCVDSVKRELGAQVTAAMKLGTCESPVSIAMTVEQLKSSGRSEDTVLAGIIGQISEQSAAIERLYTAVSSLPRRQLVSPGMFGGMAPRSLLENSTPFEGALANAVVNGTMQSKGALSEDNLQRIVQALSGSPKNLRDQIEEPEGR